MKVTIHWKQPSEFKWLWRIKENSYFIIESNEINTSLHISKPAGKNIYAVTMRVKGSQQNPVIINLLSNI